jgi:hypothetical protein
LVARTARYRPPVGARRLASRLPTAVRPVVVKHEPPKPAGAEHEDFKRLILVVLAGGTRASAKLARLCGTDANDKTFAGARIAWNEMG